MPSASWSMRSMYSSNATTSRTATATRSNGSAHDHAATVTRRWGEPLEGGRPLAHRPSAPLAAPTVALPIEVEWVGRTYADRAAHVPRSIPRPAGAVVVHGVGVEADVWVGRIAVPRRSGWWWWRRLGDHQRDLAVWENTSSSSPRLADHGAGWVTGGGLVPDRPPQPLVGERVLRLGQPHADHLRDLDRRNGRRQGRRRAWQGGGHGGQCVVGGRRRRRSTDRSGGVVAVCQRDDPQDDQRCREDHIPATPPWTAAGRPPWRR